MFECSPFILCVKIYDFSIDTQTPLFILLNYFYVFFFEVDGFRDYYYLNKLALIGTKLSAMHVKL